jgi:hypothetical protein
VIHSQWILLKNNGPNKQQTMKALQANLQLKQKFNKDKNLLVQNGVANI